MSASNYISAWGPYFKCMVIGESEGNENLGVQGQIVQMPTRVLISEVAGWYDSLDGHEIGFEQGVVVVVLKSGTKIVVSCPLHIFDNFMIEQYEKQCKQ